MIASMEKLEKVPRAESINEPANGVNQQGSNESATKVHNFTLTNLFYKCLEKGVYIISDLIALPNSRQANFLIVN